MGRRVKGGGGSGSWIAQEWFLRDPPVSTSPARFLHHSTTDVAEPRVRQAVCMCDAACVCWRLRVCVGGGRLGGAGLIPAQSAVVSCPGGDVSRVTSFPDPRRRSEQPRPQSTNEPPVPEHTGVAAVNRPGVGAGPERDPQAWVTGGKPVPWQAGLHRRRTQWLQGPGCGDGDQCAGGWWASCAGRDGLRAGKHHWAGRVRDP